jgi:hypothetical protein
MCPTTLTAILLGGVLMLGTSARANQTEVDKIDPNMGGARILYNISGGLATIDQTLRVFDDGMVRYEWSRPGDTPWFIDLRFPVSQVRALKSLFLEADFASLPARFEPRNEVVIDGVDFLVKAELADGTLKAVRSTTLASEDQGFTQIRKSLDMLVADVRATEVFRLGSYGSSVEGRVKTFAMLADGRFRYEVVVDGMPIEWYEGQVTLLERQEILDAVAAFDFTKAHVCAGEHIAGRQYELFVPKVGRIDVIRFSAEDDNDLLAPLMSAVKMVDRVVQDIKR